MKLIRIASLFLALTAVLVVGCSDDDESPTGPTYQSTNTTERASSGDYWITSIDATSYDDFTFYSFTDRDTVTLTAAQSESSTDWDLSFRRYVIATNSGNSGPGTIMAADLTDNGISKSFAAVTSSDLTGLSQGDWMEDGYDLVIDSYYNYNPQTHVLTPTNLVYAMVDAEGKFLKFQITGFYGGGAPPAMANFIVTYVYAASGTDLSGTPVVDTIDGSSGEFYYDFSSGSAVTPADPSTFTGWDLKVSGYDVYLNSSFSGPGVAAANPANLLVTMSDATDLSEYNQAIVVQNAYSQDQQGSVFTNWYDYASERLTSKNHVYVINIDGAYYKMTIETYYGDVGISGNIIFWWDEL